MRYQTARTLDIISLNVLPSFDVQLCGFTDFQKTGIQRSYVTEDPIWLLPEIRLTLKTSTDIYGI